MTDTDEFDRSNPDRKLDYLERLLETDPAKARRLCEASLRLRRWVHDAQTVTLTPIGDVEVNEPPGDPPLRFPTGVERLDERLGGGLYGFTVVSAFPKCGKSIFALGAALEAAREGWRVLYFDAELDTYERANRVQRYLGIVFPELILEKFSFHPTAKGVNVPAMIRKVEERLSLDDTQLLLIADSINRMVKQSKTNGSETSYWAGLDQWSEYFRGLAQISGRRIASLAVSELSAGGWAKGRSIEYDADVVLRIQRVDADDERYVKLSVPYARSSGGGNLGMFRLHWQTGRFEYVERTEERTETDMSWM